MALIEEEVWLLLAVLALLGVPSFLARGRQLFYFYAVVEQVWGLEEPLNCKQFLNCKRTPMF